MSANIDVIQAKRIIANINSKCCYQGQTHGHEDFLLTPAQYLELTQQSFLNKEVIFPYLTGDDLVSTFPPLPKRYIIDFHPRNLEQASQYKTLFKRVKDRILSDREKAAKEESKRNQDLLKNNPKARVNRHHKNFLTKWWLLSYPRPELIEKLSRIPRYIGCSRVSKRPIFEFIDSNIRPSDVVQVFPLADDYSFGILQSDLHWLWFTKRCSTLGSGFRYTSDSVFDTFPFPQNPTIEQIRNVADAAVQVRQIRRQIMAKNQWSLREIYRNLTDKPDLEDSQLLQQTQLNLDNAVRSVYGMSSNKDPLQFLLNLNLEVTEKEARGEPILTAGLPAIISDPHNFITNDCVKMPLQS